MIRSIVVHDIAADSIAAMERWCHRVHTGDLDELVAPAELAADDTSARR
jgi:hypothetical protein